MILKKMEAKRFIRKLFILNESLRNEIVKLRRYQVSDNEVLTLNKPKKCRMTKFTLLLIFSLSAVSVMATDKDGDDSYKRIKSGENDKNIVLSSAKEKQAVITESMTTTSRETTISGTVIDAMSGQAIPNAQITVEGSTIVGYTNSKGDFYINDIPSGTQQIVISAPGYGTYAKTMIINKDTNLNLGVIRLSVGINPYADDEDGLITFDEDLFDDESGSNQTIGNLAGSADDIYAKISGFAFGVARFRYRGYDTRYTDVYINGLNFNDPARGRFNFSSLGGMNNAFRNKDAVTGMDAADFSLGDIGGATNIQTLASKYAPGLRAGAGYTNRNYNWRAMVTYSTGLKPNGWAMTASAILRYAHEGIVPGTFYRSYGLFFSADKVYNEKNIFSFTAFAAPTQRGQAAATFEECYQLVDDNLYNPNWGYQNGKKRNARVAESFDPTVTANWYWKPFKNTTVNTGVGFRYSAYSSTALNWYNTADPRPDYYRRLPSYFSDPTLVAYYTDQWEHNVDFRQIDWDSFYQVNHLNNYENQTQGTDKGSSYMVEKRHSNQTNLMFASTVNTEINQYMNLQGGISFKWTKADFYKTVDDLLGGTFWLDIDQFAERDFPDNPDMLQNNLNNPNQKAKVDDKFGYSYSIFNIVTSTWLQNTINLPHWELYHGLFIKNYSFFRQGRMRNGRAPENSYGRGEKSQFINGGLKVGGTYKLDGRNFFSVNFMTESKAPYFGEAYLSPKIKDKLIPNLKSEIVYSVDASYKFSYKNLKGKISGFLTHFSNQSEITSFYHDAYSTYVNYALTDVKKMFKGLELGLSYQVIPDVKLTAVGTVSRYQYKNNPTGTTNYENGILPDTTQTVYLKNFYVGGSPQIAWNFGVSWKAPKLWFFDLNVSIFEQSYVTISPIKRTAQAAEFPLEGNSVSEMMDYYHSKIKAITHQQKLKGGAMLNLSVGKLIYLDRKNSLSINVTLSNITNNKNLQTGGYEQGRFDFSNFDENKYPNKYYYAQGINVFANVGYKF